MGDFPATLLVHFSSVVISGGKNLCRGIVPSLATSLSKKPTVDRLLRRAIPDYRTSPVAVAADEVYSGRLTCHSVIRVAMPVFLRQPTIVQPSPLNPPAVIVTRKLVDMPAHHMDTSRAIASSGASKDSGNALKVLGRVADAFDNPGSLHKTDKEVLFVVNVLKSRHLLPVRPSPSTRLDLFQRSFRTTYRVFRAGRAYVRMKRVDRMIRRLRVAMMKTRKWLSWGTSVDGSIQVRICTRPDGISHRETFRKRFFVRCVCASL